MSSETQTVSLLGESITVLYGGEEEQERESEINMEKLYELMKNMGKTINERLNEMSATIDAKNKTIDNALQKVDKLCEQMVSITNRVNTIENEMSAVNKTCGEFHEHLNGMSNVFDGVKEQVADMEEKTQDLRNKLGDIESKFERCTSLRETEIKKLIEENEELSDQITDLRCRSMKYNLIFSGIYENDHENTEEVLRDFMARNLDIDHQVEFTSVHRFGKKNKKRARPIVAKFIYQCDLDQVLKSAKKLKGKPFQINQQFPEEIEQARKSLYPIMKEHKQKGDHVKLVRDILYINGQPYNPETEEEYSNPPRRDRPTPNRHRSVSNKRRRISSSQETR